ncbi:hypothetical protein [Curtobacterium sp. SGAir0471]|uniref:hypothetical protein n=1 Tax=Curtobacterium sp. SGAir0471 TaxID=2070337 RepID=UPI0020C7B43B|nr:hypothetical protein [Curtobacterium sp. SGAir0471]
MPERITYVQLKTGHALDAGPAWISRVRFTKTWKTAYFHGRTLAREQSWDANFRDVDTDEWFWLSGPKRDRTDGTATAPPPSTTMPALTTTPSSTVPRSPAANTADLPARAWSPGDLAHRTTRRTEDGPPRCPAPPVRPAAPA